MASLAFGEDAGPKMIILLDQGRVGILRYTQQAEQLGFILEEEVIRNSEYAADKINEITRVIKNNFTEGLLSAFVDEFNEFGELAKDPAVAKGIKELGRDMGNLATLSLQVAAGAGMISSEIKEILNITDSSKLQTINKRISEIENNPPLISNPVGNAIRNRSLDVLKARREAIQSRLNQRKTSSEARSAEKTIKVVIERHKKEVEVLQNLNKAHEENNEKIKNKSEVMDYAGESAGRAAGAQKIYNSAVLSSADLVTESTRAIEMQGRAWDDLGSSAAMALQDIILEGGKAKSVIYELVSSMRSTLFENTAGSALSRLLNTATSGAGFAFASGNPGAAVRAAMNPGLFGPGFAEGGVTNRPAIFGEAGPEAAVPLSRGREIPVELKGGEKKPGLVIEYLDARGADREGLARLEAMIRQVNGTVERRAVAAVQDRFRRTSDYLRR
jgi:hypothetical protein